VGARRAGDDRGRWPRPDQPARAHRPPPAGGLPQAGTYALFELGTGDPSLVGRGTVPPLPRLSGEPRWIWAPRAFSSAADERETPNRPTIAPLTSNAKRAERLVHYRCPDGILTISHFQHLERHDRRVSASNPSGVCERQGASHRSRPDQRHRPASTAAPPITHLRDGLRPRDGLTSWFDGVVPFWMEWMALDLDGRELLIGDRDLVGVAAEIETGVDL
jgi:hypothetical protein